MGKTSRILYPKREGLVGKNRPLVLILSSSHDKKTTAVRYETVKGTLDGRGYTCVNKKEIDFSDELDKSSIKPSHGKKEVTVWLEAHGAPGWLFGSEASEESEIEKTIAFADYIKKLAKHMGVNVTNIVLSSCYSANEFVAPDHRTFFSSPARLLSYLLPTCHIMGFIGQNASAKATSLYKRVGEAFVPEVASLEDTAVVFQAGQVIERSADEIYGDLVTAPNFLKEAVLREPEKKYQPLKTLDLVDSLFALKSEGEATYGQWQKRMLDELIEPLAIRAGSGVGSAASDLDETLTYIGTEITGPEDDDGSVDAARLDLFDASAHGGAGKEPSPDPARSIAGPLGAYGSLLFFDTPEKDETETKEGKTAEEIKRSASGYLKLKK